MRPIKQDTISITLSMLALLISVYFSTFELGLLNIFPAFLLVAGISFQAFVNKKIEYDGAGVASNGKDMLMWILVAVAGIGLASFMSGLGGLLIPQTIVSLSVLDRAIFGVLMAVSEEQFFRGFLTAFFWTRLKSVAFAVLSSTAIFTVYHLAVYNSDPSALIYVFVAGAVLSLTAIKSGKITVPIVGHIINNLISVGAVGFITGGMIIGF